jgi:serine/threonine protein kinase
MELEQIGKYKIVGKIGKGAMGEVFRAHDPVLDRDVAIKVVSGKLAEDEGARKRFVREAKAAAQLNHPSIITVHDFGEEQGMAFIAMEILDEGQDLKDHIEQGTVTRLGLDIKVTLMQNICDGLAFAHSKGVVHQDLKPANIRILNNGGVKIMDFGLALRKDDATPDQIMGTPYYMAPEQCMGERATACSDVFSIGAVFYEFLSGQRPFTGKSVKNVLIAVLQNEPTPLLELVPDLPPALAVFVAKALSKDPQSRYQNGEELNAALAAARAAELSGEISGEVPVVPSDTTPARQLGPPLSASADTAPALSGALAEIDQYLEDAVPPLFVADSVEELQNAPVDGAAAEILGWAERKSATDPSRSVPQLLFAALRKLNVIGDLDLVESKRLLTFLKTVGAVLAEASEPGDRERLRRLLEHLGEEDMAHSGPVDAVSPEQEKAAARPETPQTKQLSILEQRLRQEGLAKAPASDPVRRRVVSQALAAAANAARDEKELKADLRRLREAGVAADAGQVFRGLGEGLGNWALPEKMAEKEEDLPRALEVEAMEKIVSLPEDPIESAKRFRHLVTTATEQFNAGHLGRAVQMIDLALELVSEKKVESGYVDPVRKQGHEALDQARLKEFMDKPDRHYQLRQVLEFFEPGLGVSPLLDQLEIEERRDRRRLILDLLLIHGAPARAAARQRLWDSAETEVSDFARRNWIYLLRLIPRAEGDPVDPEIEAAARYGVPGMPLFLVKETVNFLGQTRHPTAARALMTLLGRWESFLTQDEVDEAARSDGFAALDRLASALARLGYPQGWQALVDHALGRAAGLGATVGRLSDLGSQDLSESPEIVDRLLGEIEDSMPKGMLGRLVGRKDQDLPALVGSLAGTRTPEVQGALQDVAERFEGQPAGQAAKRALRATPPAAPAAEGLSGEIDPDGLPSLLHRLDQEKATGTLVLRPADGTVPAMLVFVQGRLVTAGWDTRKGLSAVYQLFQRPFVGTFAFDRRPPQVPADSPAMAEMAPLLRECIRRARDVERTSALLPDVVPFDYSGAAPSTVPGEPDHQLVSTLWQKACAKVTVAQMEAELTVDAYRIRHALAHWMQEGALKLAASVPPQAPPGPSATGT